MNLEILATGVDQTGRRIDLIGERALNPRRAFEDILQQLLVKERRLFDTGRGWPGLKDSTIAKKLRSRDPTVRANARRPLHATGKLAHFLTTRPAQPLKLDRTELVLGVPGGRQDFHYARYQKHRGRDPLISKGIVGRTAKPILADFLTGG